MRRTPLVSFVLLVTIALLVHNSALPKFGLAAVSVSPCTPLIIFS